MNKVFIRRNILSISILIFLLSFLFFVNTKPAFLYNMDGSLKQFGLGYMHKSVIPMWILVISLGILSYMSVMYYLLL
jgi:hypothetical protein